MLDVDRVCRELTDAGITGVASFRKRLHANRGCKAVVEGLLLEARTAHMLRRSGCSVEIRERPDLEVALGDHLFFAEVTHFRRKVQDDLDEEKLRAAGDLLVKYGDTVPEEGRAAWDQLVQVANDKVAQYCVGSPNVLVVHSRSPNCIDDISAARAVSKIDSICPNGREARAQEAQRAVADQRGSECE